MQPLVSALSRLPHLTCLSLDGVGVAPTALAALAAALPGLRALSLSGCPGLGGGASRTAPPVSSSAAGAPSEWASALAGMPRLQWLDLRGVRGVTQTHVRALVPSVLAGGGRLGPGSIALDDELAQRVMNSGTAARAMHLDANKEDVARWGRVELEVRARVVECRELCLHSCLRPC